MSDLMTKFFGPLDKSSCFYFLALSFIFFVVLVALLFIELIYVVRKYKTITPNLAFNGVILLFDAYLVYFVNRLLYTMCNKSLA
jgi:hypothetical protein